MIFHVHCHPGPVAIIDEGLFEDGCIEYWREACPGEVDLEELAFDGTGGNKQPYEPEDPEDFFTLFYRPWVPW